MTEAENHGHHREGAMTTKHTPATPHTTWGSKNAEDMYRIATRLAGFDARKLMREIHKRQRDKTRTVNERTVLEAMQTLKDRFEDTGEQ